MWCVTSVAFLLILVQICHFQNKASTVAPYQTYMDTVCLCFFTGIGKLLRQNPVFPLRLIRRDFLIGKDVTFDEWGF